MNKSSEHIKTSKLLTEYYWQNNEATKGSHAHQQWAAHCMNPQTYQGEKTKAELEAIRYNIQNWYWNHNNSKHISDDFLQ